MNIRAGLSLATLVSVLSFSSAWAAPADAPVPSRIAGTCEVAFLVTSTLHDFPGSARCLPFEAALARGEAGDPVIPSVEVEVPVAGMDTRNGTRDGQMREMFRSGQFPRIRGAARDVDVGRLRAAMGKGHDGTAPLDLLLRIRDVERKVRATVGNLKESGGRVTFDVDIPVSLGEFDLKAPSVLGIIRVGDKVSVKAAFTLTISPPP
ncbi:MAG: YceI family protein [bacterium]|jgi:polyisoprenoid-binding protein YceI